MAEAGGIQMAKYRNDEIEAEKIEELAEEAELSLTEETLKKDLKERRNIMKQTLFDGSHSLKHLIPKGKHL
jgi:hypothetical protein